MATYAQTDFEITCDNEVSAKKVVQELKKIKKESDENGNFDIQAIEQIDEIIYGEHSSERVQNLEWQCEQIWERIKKIKGVLEANFPFMVEGDGLWFSNEE